jgi:hypothetical protein
MTNRTLAAPSMCPNSLQPALTVFLSQETVEAEIRSRAQEYLSLQQLVVDYYRIGRRLAFQIPATGFTEPELEVPGIPDYPWEIWFSWELEERINCLGWNAQWLNDHRSATEAAHELRALAAWGNWTPNHRLDLCLGHLSRTLWQAYSHWTWMEPSLRDSIGAALNRLAAQSLPWGSSKYGSLDVIRKAETGPEAHTQVHNIPFIGLIGAALAANARHTAEAPYFNERIQGLLALLFQLRKGGYSEGVAYDGYLLDFLTCWLESLPLASRQKLLKEHDFRSFFQESVALAAPGELVQVAEIADVEPLHMPFHISAQARLEQWQPERARAWYLRRCRLPVLRADTLAILKSQSARLVAEEEVPAAGILDAIYATVLREGWKSDDLAVAVATSNSPAGHIHNDSGSITIGTSGRWLVADPGYQQYMPGEEREFTLGPLAHNAPVLNGYAQEVKASRLISRGSDTNGALYLKLDLAHCYPAELSVNRVIRTVWFTRNRFVVIADQVDGEKIKTVAYSWHGITQAAWRIQEGWAMLYSGSTTLWFTSPSLPLSEQQLIRLPGSRGQLTLKTENGIRPVTWWVFSKGPSHPYVKADPQGNSIDLEGLHFSID